MVRVGVGVMVMVMVMVIVRVMLNQSREDLVEIGSLILIVRISRLGFKPSPLIMVVMSRIVSIILVAIPIAFR